jgi:hypothetical protein
MKVADKQRFLERICSLLSLSAESVKTFEADKVEREIVSENAVKPFSNSQKGIGKGPLTWVTASDKYSRHR